MSPALGETTKFRRREGSKTAIAYLAGFYLGIIYYTIVVFDIIALMFRLIG